MARKAEDGYRKSKSKLPSKRRSQVATGSKLKSIPVEEIVCNQSLFTVALLEQFARKRDKAQCLQQTSKHQNFTK